MALAAASLATIVVALAAMVVILVARTAQVQEEGNGAALDNRATNQNGSSVASEASNQDAHQTNPLKEQPQNGKKPDTRIETTARRSAGPTARQEPVEGKSYPKLGTIVFVVDDAGYNMKQLGPFLDLPFPLTIAVLPGLPYSEEAARAAAASGKEVILHQPMEAIGGENPGPGAIYRSMSRQDVFDTMERNLATVPGASGINNHMGSLVTQDLYLMEAVAAVAKKHGIYYLDSLTVSGTVMPEAARREGIHYWERSVFLDNSSDRVSIIRAVEDGKKHAQANRPAVMIGHVWSAELAQTLAELYPKLIEEGYSLSTISRFMMHEASGNDADPGD